ncbi:HAD family phosphatase [Candidatus Woesearchaeota archaeon]|nr:HAD family phosphatase [Candidatus Woesearchaeota archaeon]
MRYKLVCFDLDGTLIDETESIWITLYEHLGVDLKEAAITANRFYAGEISYEEWCKSDLRLLKEHKLNTGSFKEIAAKLKVMQGAHETLKQLKEKGIKLAVISGSVDTIFDLLFPSHPFDYVFINKLVFDDYGNVQDIIPTDYDCDKKGKGLKRIAETEGISTKECVFVGDYKNDISIAKEAGLSIAFNSKSEELNSVSDVVIKEKDLSLILDHILF